MNNYGILTDELPMFLGSECVIEHLKTLRIKNRDIYRDIEYVISPFYNTVQERRNDYKNKGWIDISDFQIPLSNLFAFVGVQSLQYSSGPPLNYTLNATLNLIKFRHKEGKTQARISVSTRHPIINYRMYNLDDYIEIFIYQRLENIPPNNGYGIHIYDQNGILKYKDGLKLLQKIRKIPIIFRKRKQPSTGYFTEKFFMEEDNPQLKNLGSNIAILQTANFIYTSCNHTNGNWIYGGGVATSHLQPNSTVAINVCDHFEIYDKKRTYPSYAQGGAFLDDVICTDHLIIIDKPN